jgi:acyl-CoA reductase-like NAD-dependent aldehyde dehydrogenase
MKAINKIYINGEFVTPHGTTPFDLINPTSNQKIGEAILGDEVDTQNVIAAAKEAFMTFSKISCQMAIWIYNLIPKFASDFILVISCEVSKVIDTKNPIN